MEHLAFDILARRSLALGNGVHGFAIRGPYVVYGRLWQLRTKGNAGFGIHDHSDPGFSWNFYGGNSCKGDDLGDSDPPGLCK
jgi:hypothetical protein